MLQLHETGGTRPKRIKGWYSLAGGGAGFLLIESDDPRELTQLLEPYIDPVSWDVHAAYELEGDKAIEAIRRPIPWPASTRLGHVASRAGPPDLFAGAFEALDSARLECVQWLVRTRRLPE